MGEISRSESAQDRGGGNDRNPTKADVLWRRVAEMVSAWNGDSSFDSAIDYVTAGAAELLGDEVNILFYRLHEDSLVLSRVRRVPDTFTSGHSKIPLSEPSISTRSAVDRDVKWAEWESDGSAVPPLDREFLGITRCKRMFSLPLVSAEAIQGVLSCALPGGHWFSRDNDDVLRVLAKVFAEILLRAKRREADRRRISQMEALSKAPVLVFGNRPLNDLLLALVEQARQITGAQYGALGMQENFDETRPFDPWVFSGMNESQIQMAGPRPPRPVGMLGAVFHEGKPIRSRNIAGDSRFVGLPSRHIQMATFLGVPIWSGGKIVGNLYLAEKQNGEFFTDDDERAVGLLAQQAAVAMENARELEKRISIETDLRRMGESLAQAQAMAHVGNWEWDLQHNRVEWSDEVYKIFGRLRADFPASYDAYLRCVHADDRKRAQDVVKAAIEKEKFFRIDHRVVRPDGSERVVHGEGAVMRNAEGRAIRMFGTVHDITEIIVADTLAKRLAAIVDASEDAIYSNTLDGTVTSWNRAAERLYGYTEQEIVGQPIAILVPPDRALESGFINERLAHGESLVRFETVRKQKNGKLVDVSLTISPIKDILGHTVGGATIARDISEQTRAERALRQSAAEVADLYENAPCGYHSLDKNGVFVQINKTELAWLGYEKSEVLGQPVEKFLTPAGRDSFRINFKKFLEQGYVSDVEAEFFRKDGRILNVSVNSTLVKDERGQPLKSRATLFDITERKKTERALRESEAKYRNIVETAQEGIWIIDTNNVTTFVNARMAEMLGVSPEQAQGRSMFDFMDDAARPVAAANVQKRRSGIAETHEFRLRRADGQYLWTLMSASPILGVDGEYAGALAMVADISDLKASEEERENLLRQVAAEKNWLNAVIDNSPLAVFLVEADKRDTVRMNRTAAGLLGIAFNPRIPLADMRGRVFWKNRDPFYPEEMVKRVSLGERLQAVELMVRRAEGTEVPVVAYANPVLGANAQPIGVMGVLEDITRLKELERLRDEWVSMIAHDLRQPVTAIIGRAEIVALQCEKGGVDVQTLTHQIVQSARQVNRLIGDLFDASNIETGHMTLEKTNVVVSDLVGLAVSRASFEMQGHAVEVELAAGLPTIEADQGRLEQVLGNLLSNAAKYGYPGSAIHLSVSRKDTELLFAIANVGDGIPLEEMASIFERFHRMPESQKKGVHGLGLGLYITRGLVEAHGGRVWAESIPGKVTTFFFTIPCHQDS